MNTEKELKRNILDKVRLYYNKVHEKSDIFFVPGESRINYAERVFDQDELLNLVDSALEFWLTYGRYSIEFEKKLGDFLGTRHVFLVNSGSSANLLAFMALTSPLLGDKIIKRGDEVIAVAAGFPTTVSPIIQYGAIPVFVDVDIETFNVDVSQLEQAVSSKSKAVMLAHTLGNPFDISAVVEFCKKHNLWLIEDNCDALGSKFDGQYTGTWGDIGTSSFYPPHHMTMGEGGAVYTNDKTLKKILLSMRDWGRDCWCQSGHDNTCKARFNMQHGSLPFGYDHKYVYSHFGYNLKATDLQAAIGCAQLGKLPSFIQKRRNNFDTLYDCLKDVEQLILPRTLDLAEPSWFGFYMTLRENLGFSRNDLVKHLEKKGIQTRNLFAGNITRHPCFDSLVENQDYRISSALLNTDRIMNDSFWIGLHPGMGQDQLTYMAEQIKCYIAERISA